MQNEKKVERKSNLGTLFWDTASALPNHTAIQYHGDGQCSLVTYHELRTEVVKVREVVRRHASRGLQGIRGEVGGGSINGSNGGGHRPEVQVVGILSSGPEAVACILGVLMTCGYWYISPHYTRREVTALADRICPEQILVEDTFLNSLEDTVTAVLDTLSVFGTPFKLVSINSERCPLICRLENLVYVVPTSGTTGTPKCVYVPHASIMPNIHDFVKLFKVTSEDKIFCASPLTFDPSVIDLFLAFQVGACLVMVSPSTLRIPRLLLKILVENKITILQATPTLFLSLGCGSIRESLLSQGSWLRVLALGGEVFPKASILKECVGDGCTARIFNLYGLTEVSCWASVWEYVPDEAHVVNQTPIGKPLSHTEIKVLKENGEEADNGEEGEIHVGGEVRVCLVDIGNGATENQAVTHLRATGDLGLVKDGHIYCLGRLDDQMKRNGQKISPREIERVCIDLPYVSQCLVLPSNGRLITFVCLCDKGITLDTIWRDLRTCLALWKLPDEVVLINSVPFNTHGKVDTQELLSLMSETRYPPSHTQTLQGFFRDLWRRTLDCEDVREDDKFIFCGGNSLTAVQVTARVEEYLGHEIPEFLDALLHNSYSDVLQILRKHHLARKSDKSSGGLSKKMKNGHPGHSKPKQSRSLIKTEANAAVFSSVFSDCQSSKGMITNGDQENVVSVSQSQNTILAAVSRRGVEIREPTPAPTALPYRLSLNTYSLKWKYNLGKCIDSSPLLAKLADSGMFVFAGSHSYRLACLDAVAGMKRWCCMLGDRVESSPAISHSGSFVYVGCYDHHLYCIRVKDGKVAWRYRTGGEVKSSPVVDQETGCVAFGSHDKKLYYVGVDGEPKWVLQVSSGSIFSSPCIARGLVIAASLDGVVCGVDKNSGDVKWKVVLNKPIFSSPAAYSCGVVFGTVGGQVLSYSITGTFLWQYETEGSIFSSPFILKLRDKLEVIAIGSHDKCVYFLTHLGELMAKYCGESPVYATPFLFPGEDGCAFGAVVCETRGRCCVLRVKFGGKEQEVSTLKADMEVMWEKEFPGELFASPVFYENKLLIGCRDDLLYCFDAVDAE